MHDAPRSPPSTPYRRVERGEVTDYSGSTEPVLPVYEVSNIRLKHGPALTNLSILSSEKVAVLGAQHHVESVGVVVLRPEYFGFMWWDGQAECRINGAPARRNLIYPYGKQDGFHATGGARRTMGMALRKTHLMETLAALRGVGPEDIRLDGKLLRLSEQEATRFRIHMETLFKQSAHTGDAPTPAASAPDPSEAVFGVMIDAILASQPERQRMDRPRQPEHIVRKAEERFFARQGEPISLADLCLAAGVSVSTLYRAFDIVCGASPMAYFHKRRLTFARKALIDSPVYRGAVKHAALSVGLTEFGRFSVQYRKLFGESPSTTLATKFG